MEKGGHFVVNVRGTRIVVPAFFGHLGLSGGYSTRSTAGGAALDFDLRGGRPRDAVLASRSLVAEAMGVDPARFVLAEQVHGAGVAVVTGQDAGRGAASPAGAIPGVDALVTTARDLPLAIMSADCVPVLLADEGRRAAAAVHSGRLGTVANVTAAAVTALAVLGVEPGALYASICPCISQAAYEVGEEVYEQFHGAFTWADEVFTIVGGHRHLDLAGAVIRQLIAAGVKDERIYDSGLCTVERNDLFYSYRKEGRAAGRTAGVIQING